MPLDVRRLLLAGLAAPLILGGCTGNSAFPNLGVLKREQATTLNDAQKKEAIADLQAAQQTHKQKAEAKIGRR